MMETDQGSIQSSVSPDTVCLRSPQTPDGIKSRGSPERKRPLEGGRSVAYHMPSRNLFEKATALSEVLGLTLLRSRFAAFYPEPKSNGNPWDHHRMSGSDKARCGELTRWERGSEPPESAHPAGNSRALRIPAPKGGYPVSRIRQRLAPEIGHARVKPMSPQTSCRGRQGSGSGVLA